jgi:hypothetical protein
VTDKNAGRSNVIIPLGPQSVLRPARSNGVRGTSGTGDSNSPAVEQPTVFAFQSYFDDTLQETAIMSSPPNDPIIPSTLKKIDLSGYAVALHPASETPVAVRFKTGSSQGGSQTYRMKPGETRRPAGKPGHEASQFSGLEWGLPSGWLGGGAANLIIFRTADSRVDWASDFCEVIYHRTRVKIIDPTAVPVALANFNWPSRFPWPLAKQGIAGTTTPLSQGGQPALSLQPTRTLMRLRMSTLANAADMRVFFVGSDEFAANNAGAGLGSIDALDVAAVDLTWGSWAQLAGVPAGLDPQYQTKMLTGEMERIACNAGGVIFVDASGGALVNQYVDIVRFGRV